MNLPVQILCKDLRRYWPLAALAAAFVAIETLGPLWGLHLSTGNPEYDAVIHGFGKWPVIFILVVGVMQEDLTVGDKAFWRTRPIAGGALLAGKMVFFALVLALPAVLANIWIASALDTPRVVSLGMAVETTGFLLLAVLAFALIASLTRNLVHAGVTALGIMLIIGLLAFAIDALPPDVRHTLVWKHTLKTPAAQIVVACACGSIALVALLAHQFRTQRTGRTAALLVAAVLAVRFAANAWSIDFIIPSQTPVPPVARLKGTENLALEIVSPPRIRGTYMVWDKTLERDRPELAIGCDVNLRGIPLGRLFRINSTTSSLKLRDGREVVSSQLVNAYANWRFGWAQSEAAVCRALGLEVPAGRETEGLVTVLSLPETRVAELAGTRGRLTTDFVLGERAFSADIRLPARAGATSRNHGELWRLDTADVGEDGALRIILTHLRATSMLAPYDSAKPDLWINGASFIRGYVLLNFKRGEYSLTYRGESIKSPGIVVANQEIMRFVDFRRAGKVIKNHQIDAAWLTDAELVVLKSETVGTTTVEVKLEDFVVPSPDNRSGDFWR